MAVPGRPYDPGLSGSSDYQPHSLFQTAWPSLELSFRCSYRLLPLLPVSFASSIASPVLTLSVLEVLHKPEVELCGHMFTLCTTLQCWTVLARLGLQ